MKDALVKMNMPTTDLKLWDEVAVTNQPKWENRARVISHFIRPNDIVLDLGAGDRKLKKYIPESCGYIPVDCTDQLPGTFVVDFNERFKLPSQSFTIIVAAGFLEYILDLDSFMSNICNQCNGTYFLFTYSYSNGKPTKKPYKKLNSFCNADNVIEYFTQYVNDIREIVKFKNQSLFGCCVATEPHHAVSPVRTINELIKTEPFWKKWTF
jgi:hypothetical protein